MAALPPITPAGVLLAAMDDNNVGLKVAKISGTTNLAQGGTTSIPHGLGIVKGLGLLAILNDGLDQLFPPNHVALGGFEYDLWQDSVNVHILNAVGNSENILGKSVTVLIIYEE